MDYVIALEIDAALRYDSVVAATDTAARARAIALLKSHPRAVQALIYRRNRLVAVLDPSSE